MYVIFILYEWPDFSLYPPVVRDTVCSYNVTFLSMCCNYGSWYILWIDDPRVVYALLTKCEYNNCSCSWDPLKVIMVSRLSGKWGYSISPSSISALIALEKVPHSCFVRTRVLCGKMQTEQKSGKLFYYCTPDSMADDVSAPVPAAPGTFLFLYQAIIYFFCASYNKSVYFAVFLVSFSLFSLFWPMWMASDLFFFLSTSPLRI